jgi:hypothetical protein
MTYGNSVTASYDTIKDNDAESPYSINIFPPFYVRAQAHRFWQKTGAVLITLLVDI